MTGQVNKRRYDAIVVGAGLSGLTCALRLEQAGMRVAVLEADGHVGGRLRSGTIAGASIDQGGQWIGPSHRHVNELVEELGVLTESTIVPGSALALRDGAVCEVGASDAFDAQRSPARHELEKLAATIPQDEPWTADQAHTLDAMTVADWLRRGDFEPLDRRELELQLNVVWARPPQAVSLLYGLWFLRGSDGFRGLAEATTTRMIGGAGALPAALARRLDGGVQLDSAVVAVDRHDGHFAVHAPRSTYIADQVVIAMSPADARRIDFRPRLPTLHHLIRQHWQQVPVLKFHVAYPEPFWRQAGLSGTASTDLAVFPWCTDDTPADGSVGVLAGLINLHGSGLPLGGDARALDDAGHRETLVLQSLTRLFGDHASRPVAYEECSWLGQPFVSGVVGPTSPGLLTAYGPGLRAPVDGLHWAGSDISAIWNGWMSGAVAAGERAASDVQAHVIDGGHP